MRLTFHGGAGEVTGSNYLLESAAGDKILIDCGLAQGSRYAEEQNFKSFAYDPAAIKAVLISHAHIDHIGRLPKLLRDGFRGTIYSTPPTRDFAELLLLDSQHILAKEAEANDHEPLYSVEDVQLVMEKWQVIHYHQPARVASFRVEAYDAGHILGSAFYRIEADGKSIVFSGDLGNSPAPIIRDLEPLPQSDYTTIESTYGGRVHEAADTREKELRQVIVDTIHSGGVLMIPVFALERTQDLLYHLNDLIENHHIPRVPVYMDSPLAIKATTAYEKYKNYFKPDLPVPSNDLNILKFPGLHLCLTPEESKTINHAPAPKIIIADSGMSNGGRILHHEMRYLSDPRSCLLVVGYQSRGTLGRRLQDGAKMVRIFGVEVQVRAKVKTISAYSAHADGPRLLAWLTPRKDSLKKVFVVQGEEDQSNFLAAKIKSELQTPVHVPVQDEVVEL